MGYLHINMPKALKAKSNANTAQIVNRSSSYHHVYGKTTQTPTLTKNHKSWVIYISQYLKILKLSQAPTLHRNVMGHLLITMFKVSQARLQHCTEVSDHHDSN